MKVAVMQPYFLPYIGYFQLIKAVDVFVIYDNIQFSKKGWFHRNRILVNGKDEFITLPLKKDSDYLDVKDRLLSDSWEKDKEKLIRKVKENYKKAPFFEIMYPLFNEIISYPNKNLFSFLHNSVLKLCQFCDIDTKIVTSSSITIDHELKGQDKVLAICKMLGATEYFNPIGGLELYENREFTEEGMNLFFIKSTFFEYPQFGQTYVPWLSILDVLMFNGKENLIEILDNYTLVKN